MVVVAGVVGCSGLTEHDVLSAAPTTRGPNGTGVDSVSATAPDGARSAGSTPPAGGSGNVDPRSQTGSGNSVTIAFAGDTHFESGLAGLLKSSPTTMLDGVASVIEPADLAIVNLETSIGSGGDRQGKAFTFQAPPSAITALLDQGVDVLSMANNHGLDFGQPGLQQTLDAISRLQAPVIGIGANQAEAFRPFTATIKGQRIAVIAATDVLDAALVSLWTATDTQGGLASAKVEDRLVRAVNEARESADTVIVFLHWGTEKTSCPNASQLDLAPKLANAGADIVVGSHAHRVLGGGYLGAAYVNYGLGNFQFYAGGKGGDGAETGVLTIEATGRKLENAVWHPGRINSSNVPVLLTGAEASAASKKWDAKRGCTKLTIDHGSNQ